MSKLEIIKEENQRPRLDSEMAAFWAEHISSWIQERRQKVVWVLLFALFIFFLLFRLFSGSQAKAEKDYIEAKEISQTLLNSDSTESSLKKLKPILARRPELHQEFDALAAQGYLNIGDEKAAASAFSKVEARLKEPAAKPLLLSGRIALDSSKNLNEAYRKALELDKSAEDKTSLLYTYNIVRLAQLERLLGKSMEEERTLERLLNLYKKGDENAVLVLNAINGDGPSFVSYIKERLNQ